MSERRLLCELEGCLSEVVHAEAWYNARGYRLWCEEHTPWGGHRECCGEPCKDLLWKLRGKIMCWGPEAEREARRKEREDSEIRKWWVE